MKTNFSTVKKVPKFKAGQRVRVEGSLGVVVIYDSYLVKGKFLYHAAQGQEMLGNVPEDWIHEIPKKKKMITLKKV